MHAGAYVCACTQGKCNAARIWRPVALGFISPTTNSNFVILIKYMREMRLMLNLNIFLDVLFLVFLGLSRMRLKPHFDIFLFRRRLA